MRTSSPSLWTDRPDDWEDAEPTPDASPRRVRPAPRRRRRPVAVVVAAAALAVTGGGAYALGEAGDQGAAPGAAQAIAPTPRTDVGKVYARVSAGVVSVRVGSGSGTGFVYDTKGTIITNDHVVGEARTAKVRFGDDDALVDATIVGTDPSSDLAVLRVNPDDVGGTLEPLAFADSEKVAVGDSAIAVGYPLGLDRTATAGIISGLGREIKAPNGYTIDEVLQTDAPINPGNSGGPLLDAQGRVIGVNSQIATSGGSSGNVGIGFAVPSKTVQEVVPKLMAGQTITRPYLGISSAETSDGTGARIGEVRSGGPAAEAGLQVGDVITKLDGVAIRTPDAIADVVADRDAGDRVAVELTRGGERRTVQLTLGTRPEQAP